MDKFLSKLLDGLQRASRGGYRWGVSRKKALLNFEAKNI